MQGHKHSLVTEDRLDFVVLHSPLFRIHREGGVQIVKPVGRWIEIGAWQSFAKSTR